MNLSPKHRLSEMRLSDQTQQIIRKTVAEIFGQAASVSLFGSKVDDTAKGGDIDLLVQLNRPQPQQERKALQLVARLQMRLGDRTLSGVCGVLMKIQLQFFEDC